MLTIPRALLDAFLVFFWSWVIWTGGPRHQSYGHALFARWQAAQRLRNYLTTTEEV